MAKHYVKEEMRYDDIDAKFAKRERYTGPLSDFREKPGYRPDVRLYYVDELGRNLSAKEAFRQLSHKFHGKGSGKKKTEKRAKKILEEAVSHLPLLPPLIHMSIGKNCWVSRFDRDVRSSPLGQRFVTEVPL